MNARRRALLAISGVVLAVAFANVAGDALALATFGPNARSTAIGVLFAAMLAAVLGVAWVQAGGGLGLPRATGGAVVAATAAAVLLLRLPAPWIDLGPFGAGPLTALAVVLLPITQLAAFGALQLLGRGR